MDTEPNDSGRMPSTMRAPSWVRLLGMPVWVTGDDGRITYLNSRAESLFDRSAEECIGSACHSIVAGRKPSGVPFCKPNCAVRRMAAQGREIEPFPMCIPGCGRPSDHVRVVVIAATMSGAAGAAGALYIHCVVDDARHERFKKYLDKVVARSPHAGSDDTTLDDFQLTSRERDILRLLSEDETLHGIAQRLDLSYATIRNHVQHILGKLGVHSILEAVAFYLLVEE